jgi:hypothetical protein
MGCRYVVIHADHVIKYGCPDYRLGAGQNLAELRQWLTVKGTPAERYYAPVLDAAPDGSWLKMARAIPLQPHEGQRVRSFIDMVAQNTGYHEEDDQTDNTGEYDGRTVFIDYGYNGSMSYTPTTCDGCTQCGREQQSGVEFAA